MPPRLRLATAGMADSSSGPLSLWSLAQADCLTFGRGIYDNMKTAVEAVFVGKKTLLSGHGRITS